MWNLVKCLAKVHNNDIRLASLCISFARSSIKEIEFHMLVLA